MRKLLFIFAISFILLLASCSAPTIEHLNLTLNPGVDTIELGQTHIDTGAKASYGLRVLDTVVISNDININELGVYEITYQTTYSGLQKTIKRMVTVIDETKPIITLNPGVDTIYLDQEWVDAGIQVTDSSNEEIIIVIEGEVLQVEGEYVITYYATDESGNTAQISRYVSVVAYQQP